MSGGLLRPPALRPGARLAVVTPASAAKRELVERGVRRLEAMGYEVVLGAHALAAGPLYYAGRVEDRVADLHAAFADRLVEGIVCARGGWGTAELLPLLDAELMRANPKVFVGYSDVSSLQMWMRERAGLVTFYGPMVAADFARDGGVDERSWGCALGGGLPWQLGGGEGLRSLQAGMAEGVLWGGCLSIVAESLGTPYAPGACGGVLFLEDIGTKPYQWDRMLLHLRYAGALEGVTGIVFGDMAQNVPAEQMELLEGALRHSLRWFAGPIAIGLRCGHVDGANVTLPLGVRVRMECGEEAGARVDFLEGAVTDPHGAGV